MTDTTLPLGPACAGRGQNSPLAATTSGQTGCFQANGLALHRSSQSAIDRSALVQRWRVLRLEKSGVPVAWISVEEAVTLTVKGQVVWSLADNAFTMHGGYNRLGERSVLHLPAIMACAGDVAKPKLTPALSNRTLFRRDDHFCMYCGNKFADKQLTRDHVVPVSQGGVDHWKNVVAACQRCNNYKGGRTPEQAGMELIAIPFTPNVFEFMYLSNRQIIADQMEYLRSRFKDNHRDWQAA